MADSIGSLAAVVRAKPSTADKGNRPPLMPVSSGHSKRSNWWRQYRGTVRTAEAPTLPRAADREVSPGSGSSAGAEAASKPHVASPYKPFSARKTLVSHSSFCSVFDSPSSSMESPPSMDAHIGHDHNFPVSSASQSECSPLSIDLKDLMVEGVEQIGPRELSLDGEELDISSADFNVLQFSGLHDLRLIVFRAFMDLEGISSMSFAKDVLWEYIREVSVNYRPNPFHNFHHATSVLHFMYFMLRTTAMAKRLSSTSTFAYMLSALTHDVDHRGKTNLFEINSSSELALLYNDSSVLESHHCSMAFRLMQKSGANVLARFSIENRKDIRKTMIACILFTDMSKHAEIIDQAGRDVGIGIKEELDLADQIFVGKLLLHAADLSGPAKEFKVASAWSERVTEEFNQQNALETSLGLPTLPFMAACDRVTFLKNEIGFSGFFVAPLWRVVANVCPELQFVIERLESNISHYKKLQEELQKEAFLAKRSVTAGIIT